MADATIPLHGGPLDGRACPVSDPAPGVRLTVDLRPDVLAVEEEPASLVTLDGKVFHRHGDGVFRGIGRTVVEYRIESRDGVLVGVYAGTRTGGGEIWPGTADGKWDGDPHGAVELWG